MFSPMRLQANQENSKQHLEMDPFSVPAYEVQAWLESKSTTQQQSRTSSDLFILYLLSVSLGFCNVSNVI